MYPNKGRLLRESAVRDGEAGAGMAMSARGHGEGQKRSGKGAAFGRSVLAA